MLGVTVRRGKASLLGTLLVISVLVLGLASSALVQRTAAADPARRSNRVKHVAPPLPQGRSVSRETAANSKDAEVPKSGVDQDLEQQVQELTAAKTSLETEVQRLKVLLEESEAKRLDLEQRTEAQIRALDEQLLGKDAKLIELEGHLKGAEHKLATLQPRQLPKEVDSSQFARRAMAAEADLAAAEAGATTLKTQLRAMEESADQLNQTLRENKRKFSKREYELMLEDQRYRNKAASWLKGNRTLLEETTASLEATASELELEKSLSEEREVQIARWLKELAEAQQRGDLLSKGLRDIAIATGMGGMFNGILANTMPESMLISLTLKEVKELVARCK